MKFEKRGLWTEVELFNVRWRVIQSGLDRLIPIRALTACKQMSRDRTSWNWCDRRKTLNWVSRFAILFYLIYLRTTQMYACIINLSFKCSYINFYSCQKQTMGFFLQKRKPVLQRSIFGRIWVFCHVQRFHSLARRVSLLFIKLSVGKYTTQRLLKYALHAFFIARLSQAINRRTN